MVDLLAGIVGAVVGFAGTVVGTALGAFMGFVGSVLEGLALVAARVVDMLPNAADLHLSIPGGWIYGYSIANAFLPIGEALAFMVILVGIMSAALVVRLAVTVFHLIPKPFIGT